MSTYDNLLVDNAPKKLLGSAVMSQGMYSIRMRAERDGRHCSGGERLVPAELVPAVAAQLVARALAMGAAPDSVQCSIDLQGGDIPCRQLPAISTYSVSSWGSGRDCARSLLRRAGVAAVAVEAAIAALAGGPAPGGTVMRGAMIVDATSGVRLEGDPARGVRVSRMDLAPAARAEVVAKLAAAGLGHHRVAEALVLAGKVLLAPGIVAELCWSDDPAYVVGYVADPRHGYQRIDRLKAAGDPRGGRAFFVNPAGWSLENFSAFLERQPMLFASPLTFHPPQSWSDRNGSLENGA